MIEMTQESYIYSYQFLVNIDFVVLGSLILIQSYCIKLRQVEN